MPPIARGQTWLCQTLAVSTVSNTGRNLPNSNRVDEEDWCSVFGWFFMLVQRTTDNGQESKVDIILLMVRFGQSNVLYSTLDQVPLHNYYGIIILIVDIIRFPCYETGASWYINDWTKGGEVIIVNMAPAFIHFWFIVTWDNFVGMAIDGCCDSPMFHCSLYSSCS